MKEEIIHSFGPPRTIVSDNAACFSATALKNFMSQQGIYWKPVLAYDPMSNGKAECMVRTIQRSIQKTLLGQGAASSMWESALKQILYEYRRCRLSNGFSLSGLMCGVAARPQPHTELNQIPLGGVHVRNLELLAALALRATRIAKQAENYRKKVAVVPRCQFNVGDQSLVARGIALGRLRKWPWGSRSTMAPVR